MKKIVFFILLLTNVSYFFSDSYEVKVVTGKKSISYDNPEKYLPENQVYNIVYASASNTVNKEEFPYVKDNNEFALRINDLVPEKSKNLFDKELISYGTSNDKVLYLPDYFAEALKENNYKKLEEYNVFFEEFMRDEYFININSYLTHKTSYYPVISNVLIGFMTRENILIKNIIKKSDSCYICDGINAGYTYFDPDDYKNHLFYFLLLDYEQGENMQIELKVDGDYLNITELNKNKNLQTLIKVDQSFINQCINLFSNQKTDLSKVTWPRHADGSCDYDGSKKSAAVQTSKSNSSNNVTKNKIMTVSENLKLRSGEATSTQVLTVMSAGTKVKILELGKAETIDGINSNWVKVEVQADAKDRNGKPIKLGTVGWCYGGYLK